MTSSAPPDHSEPLDRLLAAGRGAETDGRPEDALAAAWKAFERAPGDLRARNLLSRLLRYNPALAGAERRDDLARLLVDPLMDPLPLAAAAWNALLAGHDLSAEAENQGTLAAWMETDSLAHRLLEEAPVNRLDVEIPLTSLRRWLLLSGRWRGFPRLVEALRAQAVLNGGAWLRDGDEQTQLDGGADPRIAAAYSPPAWSAERNATFADPVTRVVADQYRSWPYPAWSRVAARPPTTLPDWVARLDGGRPSALPVDADILIAGCGTGRETAQTAITYPDARIVAVDLSETSLAFAAERCAAAGIGNVDFRLLDIHRVADLGMSFDLISCCGVLHHLPDPEAGWEALTTALRPGGAMRIMVYSIIARLLIRGARTHIVDLLDRPIDAHLLRAVRGRLIERAPQMLSASLDFYTLAGVHDLLLHRHEDPFDVSRIKRAIDALGLELLAFELPTRRHRAHYLREHPDDPGFRDVKAWATLEKSEPFLFTGMYEFWCRKPQD